MAKVVGSQKWVLSSDGRRLLRRALVAKDWGCAGVTFRREFLTPVVSGGQVGGRQAGVPLGKEKQANNVGRAKLKVQLLLLANREAVARSGWFWTGTFAEDVTDYAVASASWSAFVSRLRRRWPDVSWVCVPEIQEGRAAKYGVRVWHFHAAIWGVGVSHGSEFWPLWSAACGVNSRQLAEHRAAFGARTEADAKIIAGLRSEIGAAQMAVLERDSLISERDGLLTQVQDMRVEINRLQWENAAIKVLGDPIALSKERDALRAEVARLKSPTPKHPIMVGEYVKASNGAVAQVLEVHKDWYLIDRGHGWTFANCEPCDPPATHDTPEGRSVAESVIRDGRKTEPVAEEIKAGDVIEVVSSTHKLYTEYKDLGRRGVVTAIDGMRVSVGAVPGYELPIRGIVGKCDVRKVPQ